MADPAVCVSIVTYNSAVYIRRCLDAVLGQRGVKPEIVVVDNASGDATLDILQEFAGQIRLIPLATNIGFAAAQNLAIESSPCAWVFTLNPDVLLQPDFIASLVEAARLDPRTGSVCGKLLSIGRGFVPLAEPRIDSTGIYFTPTLRHFDRGWSQPDRHQFEQTEYVFGACAAAALYRREMIQAIGLQGHFFDADFFAYREDADVAWRAQLLGWRCVYTPAAVGWHVRSVSPANRRSIPPVVNMHSVKNRFLLRIKNATPGLYRRFWLPMTARDLLVIAACVVSEPRSLPAFWHLGRALPAAWRARREIMSRKTASDEMIARWFCFEAAAEPHPATTAVFAQARS